MTRPRAADDFGAIRSRLLELRRERNQAVRSEGDQPRAQPCNRPRDRIVAEGREEFRPFRDRFTR